MLTGVPSVLHAAVVSAETGVVVVVGRTVVGGRVMVGERLVVGGRVMLSPEVVVLTMGLVGRSKAQGRPTRP